MNHAKLTLPLARALVWCRSDQSLEVLAASGPVDFGGAMPLGEQLWLWTGASFRRLTNEEALALVIELRMPWEVAGA